MTNALTGKDIHAAWRDGMLAQGRPVPEERMSWETLSEPDKQLDDLIALRLYVQGASSAGDSGMTVDPASFIKMTRVYYENIAKIRVLEAKLQDIAGATVTRDQPALCKTVKKSITPEAYYEACETHDYEFSECPFRPFTNRILALQKRMAWRAIATFTRRVDQEFIIPSLGKHYSARPDGTPYCYTDDPHFHQDDSPSGLYPTVIVPKELVGRVIAVRPVEQGEGERL